MSTSLETPISRDAGPASNADIFPPWEDAPTTPRMSHRAALLVMVAASLGGYALLYEMGSAAARLFF